MKYKMTFESLDHAKDTFCKTIDQCANCPLSFQSTGVFEECDVFVVRHPDEAVKLMGLEPVKKRRGPKLAEQGSAKAKIYALTPMKRFPKQCNKCFYYDSIERYCLHSYYSLERIKVSREKPAWCPLAELEESD